jgi:hypothetical protein
MKRMTGFSSMARWIASRIVVGSVLMCWLRS